MDVLQAIHERRSVGKVKDIPVEKEKIEQLLEAATWAPNHHHTEPWKFFVLTGKGRLALGKVLAEIAKEDMTDSTTEENQEKLLRIEKKSLRAPVIIVVAVVPSNNSKVSKLEEICAVNAAIQNILLTAHQLSLGAIWRTGKPAYHPKTKALFGLREIDEILGFIYVGYPDMQSKSAKRTSYKEKTTWIHDNK